MFFLSFGDWGENTELKKRIAFLIFKQNPHALLTLGDNFYPYGVDSIDDELWQTIYEPYFGDTQTFAILGNHDYLSKPNVQMKYPNPNWIMPRRYYDRMYKDVHIIALDTIELALDTSRAFIPESKLCHKKGDDQLYWLDHVLRVSTSPWKIVMGHYPLYSNGPHGDTIEMIDKLEHLFIKYKVNLYLAGHDHICSHTKKHYTDYIVSGAGSHQVPSRPRFGFTNVQDAVAFVDTSVTRLRFGFISVKGNVLKEITYTS